MSWNNKIKPTTNSFSKLGKPFNAMATTGHTKGKFMGILGLTYVGNSSTAEASWTDFVKPTTDSFNKLAKPI